MSEDEYYLEYENERARLEKDEDSLDHISSEDSSLQPKIDSSFPDGDPGRRLAVVVGHSNRSPGLIGTAPISMNEYHWAVRLAEKIVRHATSEQIPCKVFFRDGVGIDGTYEAAEAWGAKAAVELHFNAYNGKFRGSGTLYGMRNPKSKDYARMTQSLIVSALGTVDRGVVQRTGEERGAASLARLSGPSILVEPFFGDNPDDAKIGVDKEDALAKAILDGFIATAKNGL